MLTINKKKSYFSLGPSVSIDYGDGFGPVNEALVSKDEPTQNENLTNPPPGKQIKQKPFNA